MDSTTKRRFEAKWEVRQRYIRDTIKDHLYDRAVEARIDWVHHRNLGHQSSLNASTTSPGPATPQQRPATPPVNSGSPSRTKSEVTKIMSPFPKSAADVVEDFEAGSLDAVHRENLDMDYRVLADDKKSRWEETLVDKDASANSEEALDRIRESFSETTLRLIERTKRRMYKNDRNRQKYMNLTRRHLGIAGDSDEEEEDDDMVGEEEDIEHGESSLGSSRAMLGGIGNVSSILVPGGDDLNDSVAIGTSMASPEQRRALRRRKWKKFGYQKSGGGGAGDDVPDYGITPDEERRVFTLLNPRMGTKGKVWKVSTPMVWTPETTITMKGHVKVDGTGAIAARPLSSRYKGTAMCEIENVKVSRSPMLSKRISRNAGEHLFRHGYSKNPAMSLKGWHGARAKDGSVSYQQVPYTHGRMEVEDMADSFIKSRTLASSWETKAKVRSIMFHKQKQKRHPAIVQDASKRVFFMHGKFVSPTKRKS